MSEEKSCIIEGCNKLAIPFRDKCEIHILYELIANLDEKIVHNSQLLSEGITRINDMLKALIEVVILKKATPEQMRLLDNYISEKEGTEGTDKKDPIEAIAKGVVKDIKRKAKEEKEFRNLMEGTEDTKLREIMNKILIKKGLDPNKDQWKDVDWIKELDNYFKEKEGTDMKIESDIDEITLNEARRIIKRGQRGNGKKEGTEVKKEPCLIWEAGLTEQQADGFCGEHIARYNTCDGCQYQRPKKKEGTDLHPSIRFHMEKEGTEDAEESPAGIAELEAVYNSPPHDSWNSIKDFKRHLDLMDKQRREFVEASQKALRKLNKIWISSRDAHEKGKYMNLYFHAHWEGILRFWKIRKLLEKYSDKEEQEK